MVCVAALLCAAALSSPGCDDAKAKPRPLPKLADLEPGVITQSTGAVAPLAEVKRRRIISQKLVYPRADGRVDVALSALDEPQGLSQPLLARWRANGLHIAELRREDLGMFKANLPRTVSLETLELMPGKHYGPIDLISRTSRRQPTRYIDRQGNAQVHRFIGGRYRFLAKMVGSIDDDQLRLDLLPHHYGPRDSLLARPAGEKLLDGTTFDELRLLHPMPENRAWLIWSDPLPIAKPDPNRPIDTTKTIEAPLLGQSMMCGELHGKPVRMVLVITSR